MSEIIIEYFEDLNISGQICPPEDIFFSDGQTEYYRVVKTDPAEPGCFISHRLKFPTKVFNDECEARSLSISNSIEGLLNSYYRTPAHKNKEKLIGVVILCEQDGAIKQTGADHHHSWWRSKTFKLESVTVTRI